MTAFAQCPCTGVNLDKFIQPVILLSLAEQDLHGYGLVQKIVDSPLSKGDKPDPTGVYRFLRSMEERNLVVSSWALPQSGAPKRVYRITAEGLACLDRWTSSLRDYANAIEALVVKAEVILERSDRGNCAHERTSGTKTGVKARYSGAP